MRYGVRGALTGALMLVITLAWAAGAGAQEYVGSETCSECHNEQFEHFVTYSKKAKSWHSIEIMASDLTPDEQASCYGCHTTGYGKGGFISITETPALADVGCETCHGPGGEHAASGDTDAINRTPTVQECETCHNAERVEDFNFKPLIFSGAH